MGPGDSESSGEFGRKKLIYTHGSLFSLGVRLFPLVIRPTPPPAQASWLARTGILASRIYIPEGKVLLWMKSLPSRAMLMPSSLASAVPQEAAPRGNARLCSLGWVSRSSQASFTPDGPTHFGLGAPAWSDFCRTHYWPWREEELALAVWDLWGLATKFSGGPSLERSLT